MITLHRGEVRYSTKKPMTFAEALAFGKCLQCNPLFRDPLVECLPRPKDPIRAWRVVWTAASGEPTKHRVAALQAERDRRAHEQIAVYDIRTAGGASQYDVHNRLTGETYEVFWDGTNGNCNCPDHEVRCRPAGAVCKHVRCCELQLRMGLVTGQAPVYAGRLAL